MVSVCFFRPLAVASSVMVPASSVDWTIAVIIPLNTFMRGVWNEWHLPYQAETDIPKTSPYQLEEGYQLQRDLRAADTAVAVYLYAYSFYSAE